MSKYQGRVDPLELLRGVYTEGKKVRLKDKSLIFEKEIKLSLTQLTAWVSPISGKQYSLGSLWLYMENHLKRIPDYINKVTELGVDNVTISDRPEIVNYFLGKISESACISQEAKLSLSLKQNPQRAQPTTGFQEEGLDPSKKVKTEGSLPMELQVIEFINKFERPTSSKTRSLRCPWKSFEGLLDVMKVEVADGQVATRDKRMRINVLMEKKKNPIIVVPQHLHPGNLCLGNIEEFMVNGNYQETYGEVGFKRWLDFEYAFRGKKLKFDVTNSPGILRMEDWDQVVAVFVEGRKGEFDTWAIKQPSALFTKTKGFLLRFPTKEPTEAHEWNIRVLTLDKNVRYRDSEIQSTIWKEIETYLYQKV